MIITDEVEIYGANADVKIDNLCKAVSIPENSWTVEASKKALHNNHGIEMAVVGIGAKLEHSLEEHIYVEDMKKAVVMIVELLKLSAE